METLGEEGAADEGAAPQLRCHALGLLAQHIVSPLSVMWLEKLALVPNLILISKSIIRPGLPQKARKLFMLTPDVWCASHCAISRPVHASAAMDVTVSTPQGAARERKKGKSAALAARDAERIEKWRARAELWRGTLASTLPQQADS